jgi:hypothetical protein
MNNSKIINPNMRSGINIELSENPRKIPKAMNGAAIHRNFMHH